MTASDHTLQTVQKSLAPTGASIHAQIAFAKDSLSEFIVLAGGHEQLDTDDIQDPKLESV